MELLRNTVAVRDKRDWYFQKINKTFLRLQLDCQVRDITFLAIFTIYYFGIHDFPMDEIGASFGTQCPVLCRTLYIAPN